MNDYQTVIQLRFGLKRYYNTPTNSDKKPKKSYSNLVTIYKNIGVLFYCSP
jgi:hypothetical protein